MNDLRKARVDIAYIQETHFREDRLPVLKNRFFPLTYHSTNKTKSRGTSILLSNRIQWSHRDSMLDPEGRFTFIKGSIGDVQLTLATIYAQNACQDTFIRHTLSKLSNFQEGQLILGGDFNTPLAPSVDTSSETSSISTKARKRIAKELHEAQLMDVWRLQHPGERNYTFCSPPHKLYTRIDYFLIPHGQLHAVYDSTIGLRTWSDHAPITPIYKLSNNPSHRTRFWRLNEGLLQNPDVMEEVNRELKYYFQTNTTVDCTLGKVWEAHKTVIRGIFIKHDARIKREKGEQLEKLLATLHDTETWHKRAPDPLVEAELAFLHNQIDELLNYKAKAALQKCCLIAYESGNKCRQILARAVKEIKMQSYIPHIKTATNTKVSLPRQIANTLKEYYANLYNIMTPPRTQPLIEAYLSSAQMPTLTPENIADIDALIMSEALELVLHSTKQGKAPGPDCLTLQYYKTLFLTLFPHMVTFHNKLRDMAAFSRDTLGAHITVIPKDNKDPTVCSSYRPISLLYTDLKLFTKILATRLARHLQSLVHLDQVGFIPTREAKDSTIKVLNLIHVANQTHTPTIFINTDAEKAFDSVNWE